VVGATRASDGAVSSPGSEEGERRDADEVRSRSDGAGARVEHVAAGGAVVGAGGINPAIGAAHVLETCTTKRERRRDPCQTVVGFRPPCPVNVGPKIVTGRNQ
jgi:hypothetical protein